MADRLKRPIPGLRPSKSRCVCAKTCESRSLLSDSTRVDVSRVAAESAAGIRINAIAPGPTESEMFRPWLPTEAARAALAAQMPMNYVAHPDDMPRAALFLLSDESRWTTCRAALRGR